MKMMQRLTNFLRISSSVKASGGASVVHTNQMRCFNSHRTSIARIGRLTYKRLYPTLLVQPDGSTITVRYNLPQRMIKLPIDINNLSEEQIKAHLERRKPSERIVIEEEIEDDFNANEYIHLWKGK